VIADIEPKDTPQGVAKMSFLKATYGAIAAVLMLTSATCFAGTPMTKQEIAQLPQDKVAAIKNHCARKWGDNFDMRLYCEDEQYKALKTLIDRD
jgi:hypothetical protein